jgi:7,8-dihydropterin-6-yl-methyl-4-(beta-D-ribofuranosyl)aminobenzene 5'-phosphate synthase
MKLQIVYDNHGKTGFKEGWGFSCYLPEYKLLFDTGWDSNRLLDNMKNLNIDPREIKKVVISHQHWDHVGGLPGIIRPGMEVIVPASFSEHMKGEIKKIAVLKEVKDREEIIPGIISSGQLGSKIKEQAIAVKTAKGLLVITGCAHPGVGTILKTLEPVGEIKGLLGGLHGFDKYLLLENMELIVATHCTQHADEIAQKYPDAFKHGRVGDEIFF